jgi:hypothetical protein
VLEHYWWVFVELIRVPFQRGEMVWGIVPLYFGWLLNELTSPQASFRTATQTGFAFLWAGAHWLWQYFRGHPGHATETAGLFAVNVIVTLCVITLGLVAMVSGLRRRYPKHCSFLGHTRFSAYFMIAMFPIQAKELAWSVDRVIAILLFACPLWLGLHLALSAVRKGKE